MKYDIDVMLRNNINAVRTCHYPDRLEWYRLCDRNGIYVMAETNLESHGTWQKMGAVEPSYNVPGNSSVWEKVVVDRAVTQYETLKNHPPSCSGPWATNRMRAPPSRPWTPATRARTMGA